jgi:hypothetical protein
MLTLDCEQSPIGSRANRIVAPATVCLCLHSLQHHLQTTKGRLYIGSTTKHHIPQRQGAELKKTHGHSES